MKDKSTGKIPDFVFGLPFPKIDKSDPQAACKIARNFDVRRQPGRRRRRHVHAERHRHQRRVPARQGVHPRAWGTRAGSTARSSRTRRISPARRIAGAIEPQDVEGVSTLHEALLGLGQPGPIWAYVPSTRRVRRVNAATRSDPVAGLDIFADDLNCYAGKVEYYKWKLVGEGNILAPVLQPTRSP